jgi:hypothetical protein
MKHTLKSMMLSVGSAAFLFVATAGASMAGPSSVASPNTVGLSPAVITVGHYGYGGPRKCCKHSCRCVKWCPKKYGY